MKLPSTHTNTQSLTVIGLDYSENKDNLQRLDYLVFNNGL